MNINGITSLNQYAAVLLQQPSMHKQEKSADEKAGTHTQAGNTDVFEQKIHGTSNSASKPAAYDDVLGRIANIPDIGQYEAVIQRFLSGESEMEDPGSGKPLTKDQIVLRGLMRAYQRTDTRSLSQVKQDMERGSQNFFAYWKANGKGAPMPGRLIAPDGSFTIFNTKAEQDEYLKNKKMDFLKNAMSVITAGKEKN